MNFSYVDPRECDKDLIRLRLGDTVKSKTSLMDEEIEYVLDKTGNVNRATIECGELILAKLSKQVDYTIGPEKAYASQAYEQFERLLSTLKKSYNTHNIPIANVGKPVFRIGMHDNVL